MPSLQERTATPLLIGVTGHIDLFEEHIPALKRLVEAKLRGWLERYPHTPLAVLSPLAAGADQLVAEVALQLREETGGRVRLYAQLPLPAEAYLADFPSEASVRQFRRLLALADHAYVLEPLEGREQTREQLEWYYAAASDQMTKHAHILIALWDGVVIPDATAGTSYTVCCMRDGIDSELRSDNRLLDPVTGGMIVHIRTPRRKRPVIEDPLTVAEPIYSTNYPQEDVKESFDRILDQLDAYNRQLLHPPVPLGEALPRDLVGDGDPAAVPDVLRPLCRMFAAADALAVHYQRKHDRQHRSLLVLAVLLLVFYELTNQIPLLGAGYLVCFGVAVGYYRWGNRKAYKRNYLDLRALAEGLRVQFFWTMCGMNHDVSEHYLAPQRSGIEWICSVIRTEHFFLQMEARPASRYRWVRDVWLDGQAAYFGRSIVRKKRLERRGNRIAASLFAPGAAGIFAIMAANVAIDYWTVQSALLTWLMVAAASLTAAGLAYEGHLNQRAYRFYISEHKQMKKRFDYSLFWLDRYLSQKVLPDDRVRRLMLKLGQEVLEENGAWVYVNRERETDLPKGL